MKNIFEVLRQKEAELQQVQKEIEALRIVAPLLAEEDDPRSERSETIIRPVVASAGPGSALRANKESPPIYEASLRQFR